VLADAPEPADAELSAVPEFAGGVELLPELSTLTEQAASVASASIIASARINGFFILSSS
jgi:hypothetical protein